MKKKLICLVSLLVLFTLSFSFASADEILFRSTPWLGNVATVLSNMPSSVNWGEPYRALGKSIVSEIRQRSSNYDNNYPCVCTVTSTKGSSLTVAGYKVASVKLYFAYTPNAAGRIDHDAGNTSFYMARYTFSPIDSDVAFSDLTEKLTGIYGVPATVDNSDECSNTGSYKQWIGDNGTRVVLIIEDSYSDDKDVYIFYACDKGDELIKQAEELQKQQEADELRNAGADGL